MRQKKGIEGSSEELGKVVVVAVKASKEISRVALVWALTHVVQPGDCIKLLVIIPDLSPSKRIWGFSRFTSDCHISSKRPFFGTALDQKRDIADSCSKLMFQLHDLYDPEKVKIKLKIVSSLPCGVVALEAKRVNSSWVILDKKLKLEKKCCMEELQCNIVAMKGSLPNILRLNLVSSPKMAPNPAFSPEPESYRKPKESSQDLDRVRGHAVSPASSADQGSALTPTDLGSSSLSSSDPGTSPFCHTNSHSCFKKDFLFIDNNNKNIRGAGFDFDCDRMSLSSRNLCFQPWMVDKGGIHGEISEHDAENRRLSCDEDFVSIYESLPWKFSKLNKKPGVAVSNYTTDLNLLQSVREAISLARNIAPAPPPLCSICQHKTPVFGKPPRWFTFSELEFATAGFSQANFLAEGGFGSVHRGVLPDGQVIAVKQHKLASCQGDQEFCSEVEVLSCAQHCNVVTLIGYCVEEGRRLLIYEYICNGSLDAHLYGRNQDLLEWSARCKIAVGVARGLRYLHEECRVGCIVHRDMRPNNILLTHDFEPLVGDFGLARWQPDGDKGVETRVIGTFGYLAPEYAQSGQITEKADVYSFGVVLLELVTGRKAIDINRPRGQQCLTEWARPLLEKDDICELVDPRLRNCYVKREVHGMLQCSFLCIQRDPHSRPRMSQVLRMLEGDTIIDSL